MTIFDRIRRQPVTLGLALLPLTLMALPVRAHDPDAEEGEAKRWQGEAGLSFLSTTGNTDTESFGLDFHLDREPDPWGLGIKVQVQRAEEDGLRTAERYFLGLRGKRAVGERWELFFGLSGEQDEFAGIDLRTLAEVGFSYQALVGPKHDLVFDMGATWTDEDRVPPELDSDSIGAILGLKYEWQISDSATLSERLTYYPNFDDSDDWRYESTTALTASLNARFALQLAYDLRFRNQPVGDRDDTDASTKVSLVMNL
ncbi:MAG: DUF481 domain-containing protein [Acidobacteriota bacterium]